MAYLGKPYELIETEKELVDLYGRRMSISQIGREIGIKDWNTILKFVSGLNPLVINGRKHYKTSEVAELIYINTGGD